MRRGRARAFALFALAALCALASCSTILGVEDVKLRVDAGIQGDPSQVPPGCEPSPKDDPTVITDRCGVYVAPGGDDNAPGTRDKPVATLGQAIEVAVARHVYRVYACATTYPGPFWSLQSNGGVSLYGGFTCPSPRTAGWSYSGEAAIVAASPGNLALRIDGASRPLSFEDLDLRSVADTTVPGQSSVVALVTNVAHATFRRVTFGAGDGTNGASAAGTVPRQVFANSVDGTGAFASGPKAGGSQTCTCHPSNTTTGGGGAGDGTVTVGDGGTPAGQGNGGAPGTGGSCNTTGSGQPGAPGFDAPAADPPTALGAIDPDHGWAPSAGATGGFGTPAQGGGGGRGGADAGGGGGGCGGCGGPGGNGGGGGGASIALVSVESTIDLVASTLTTKNGGLGGDGALGAGGNQGPAGGTGTVPACNGGAGGRGGAGGAGAGGAGGLSAGIVAQGPVPTLDADTHVTFGTLARGGLDGRGATSGKRAPDGVAVQIYKP